jgi:cholest-4-en-3-one 26-monooxygenase
MELSDVDLNDLDAFEAGTPHEQFKLLRNQAPVHRHPGAPGDSPYWCITKHADLKMISKNPEIFSSEEAGTMMRDPDPETIAMLRQIMLNMDPPRHRQYRAIVNKAFTPRMVKSLDRAVDGIIARVLDNVAEKGECDFVDDIAAILPMEVICEMVGVPQSDRRAIYDLGNKMVGFDDPEYHPNGLPRGEGASDEGDADMQQASAEMFLYAAKLRDMYTKNPADNLATALINAEVDGQRLSELEFNSFFLILAIAGNETTRTVTANGMWDLMRHPDQQQRLANDLSLIPTAVEEILRFNPAVHSFRRQVMQDTVLRGEQLRAGDKLMLWYPAVNRDEEVFDDPDTFDITRDPNDHLSFGVGEHFCLGANLARMELRKIFTGVLGRFPDMELAAPPRRLRSNFINGVKEMRVKFTPSAPTTTG